MQLLRCSGKGFSYSLCGSLLSSLHVDVDECIDNPCSPHARCINEPGSFRCVCLPGYRGDGFVCEGEDSKSHRVTLCFVILLYSCMLLGDIILRIWWKYLNEFLKKCKHLMMSHCICASQCIINFWEPGFEGFGWNYGISKPKEAPARVGINMSSSYRDSLQWTLATGTNKNVKSFGSVYELILIVSLTSLISAAHLDLLFTLWQWINCIEGSYCCNSSLCQSIIILCTCSFFRVLQISMSACWAWMTATRMRTASIRQEHSTVNARTATVATEESVSVRFTRQSDLSVDLPQCTVSVYLSIFILYKPPHVRYCCTAKFSYQSGITVMPSHGKRISTFFVLRAQNWGSFSIFIQAPTTTNWSWNLEKWLSYDQQLCQVWIVKCIVERSVRFAASHAGAQAKKSFSCVVAHLENLQYPGCASEWLFCFRSRQKLVVKRDFRVWP